MENAVQKLLVPRPAITTKKMFTGTAAIAASTIKCGTIMNHDLLDELFELMNIEEVFTGIFAVTKALAEQQVKMDDPEINGFIEYFFSGKIKEIIMRDMKGLYFKSFTNEEIQGLVDFYKSPIGRSYCEKLPSVTKESAQIGANIATYLTPEFIDKEFDAWQNLQGQKTSETLN